MALVTNLTKLSAMTNHRNSAASIAVRYFGCTHSCAAAARRPTRPRAPSSSSSLLSSSTTTTARDAPFRNTYMYERMSMLNRPYFTNTDQMNKSDPYHILDLQWGVGSDDKLESEIKVAFRRKALMLHPDVNKTDTPEKALHKFQQLQKAYSNLMDVKGSHRDDLAEEWSFAVWRHGDIMSQERTDVAGHARKRPVKPAVSVRNKAWGLGGG
mmetsp:Transcript_30173/g.65293  ORF Transcript_30173/g.65293 Transcript_30173/m.65293 type:complete len:212 (-) Transcript_30173:342-977(-)